MIRKDGIKGYELIVYIKKYKNKNVDTKTNNQIIR
jgi:hypothetical protein